MFEDLENYEPLVLGYSPQNFDWITLDDNILYIEPTPDNVNFGEFKIF